MGTREPNEELCAVFITEAKEYVVRDRICLRLRDRRTGRFEPVLPNRVLGAVPPPPEHYACETGEPRIGDRLCIQMGSRYLVSTPILTIERARLGSARSAHEARPMPGRGTPTPEV
jgi:hypothetical protein